MSAAIFFTIALCWKVGEAARIFAWFPTPFISHQVVFRPLTQELARRGHEVTVVTTDPAFPKGQTPANLTEIDVHDVSYDAWNNKSTNEQDKISDDLAEQMALAYYGFDLVMEKQLKTEEMRNIIAGRKKFDLLMIEAITVGTLALKHVFKTPVVMISSLGAFPGNMDTFGAPTHPFLYPSILRKRLYNLTKWEKLQELYSISKLSTVVDAMYSNTEKALYKYFDEDIPPLRELAKDVDLLLLNDHQVWSGIHPVPPNVVYIGGIHREPIKPLSQDLQHYLDTSKHGVIYMSFGTNVDPKTLPPEKIEAFIKAFSELPYDVLWKWNEDELPGRTKNIRISKWLPQSDLLYHPNLKLFITQGGLQSTEEAIYAGLPVIGVPILGDQWYNVEHYVHHKVGLQLDINTLDAEEVKKAIQTVIGDTSFRKNMVKIRDLMRDEPMPALERAVWWTEHVLRHGGARHLRAPAAGMPWARYYELDLALAVLAVLLEIFLLGLMILCFIVELFTKRSTVVKVERSKIKHM